MIFGIMGACRRHELHNIKFDHIKDVDRTLIVNVVVTKTNTQRIFTVTGKYYDICKNYINLRPKVCATSSFFVNYYNGKCTSQNIGINKLGNLGKQIAIYLNLSDANLYTGHCFRRTSATVLVDAGGDITTLKRHGGWKSTSVAEGYIDNSIQNKINVSNTILNSIENKNINSTIIPSSSMVNAKAIPNINISNCTITNLYINKE